MGLAFALALFFDGSVGSSYSTNEKLLQKARIARHLGPRRAIAVTVLCLSSPQETLRREHHLVESGFGPSNVIGTAADCAEILLRIAEIFAADEMIVATWTNDLEERMCVYSSLATALNLRSGHQAKADEPS